jgi:hypothetical protein
LLNNIILCDNNFSAFVIAPITIDLAARMIP